MQTIQYDQTIRNQKEMIKNGEHQELYHEWAMTARTDIRADLAFYGYELDTLIHDPNAAILLRENNLPLFIRVLQILIVLCTIHTLYIRHLLLIIGQKLVPGYLCCLFR